MRSLLKSLVVFILEIEARLILNRHKPKIVGVTGSVGKTSTKDAIYEVVSDVAPSRKNKKSLNSEIGVPLTIIGADNAWDDPFKWLLVFMQGVRAYFSKEYPRWLVLEIGADRPGDIEKICSWVHPDVAVVTGIGTVPVHVEFFPSLEALVVEKSFLPRSVKEGGLAIMNFDDSYVREMAEVLKVPVISYGFDRGVTMLASNDLIAYDEGHKPSGMTMRIDYEGKSIPIELAGALGRSPLYALLAAAAFGVSQGVNLVQVAESLKKLIPPPGRMRLIAGNKESIIIDDSYNSSPIALMHALDTLARIETKGRRIAVLGDMMELGQYTKNEHEKAGSYAVGKTDRLFLVGRRVEYLKAAALEKGYREENIFSFDTADACGEYLDHYLKKNDTVLVKGSQSIRLEKVVKAIMAHPKDAASLLVRQENEWKYR